MQPSRVVLVLCVCSWVECVSECNVLHVACIVARDTMMSKEVYRALIETDNLPPSSQPPNPRPHAHTQVVKILCIATEYGPAYLLYICLALLRHGAAQSQPFAGGAGPRVSGEVGGGARDVGAGSGAFEIAAEIAYLHAMEAKYGSLCHHYLHLG